MKLVISGIAIEGTPQEVWELLTFELIPALADPGLSPKNVGMPVSKPEKALTLLPPKKSGTKSSANPSVKIRKEIREALDDIKVSQSRDYLEGVDEFLSALYRYKPSNTSMGRESLVIKLLSTGEPYTVKRLTREIRSDIRCVKKAITRALAADCVIQATNLDSKTPLKGVGLVDQLSLNSKVKMLAIGTLAGAREAREKHEIKYIKIKKPSKVKVLNTGSAPITKIIHPENRKTTE